MLGDNVMDEKEIKKIVNKNIKTFFIKQIVFTCIKEILLLNHKIMKEFTME